MLPNQKISVAFFGTPEFAIPSYLKLLNDNLFDITTVISQSGKPKGRGGKIQDPPMVIIAKAKSQTNIFQPHTISKIKITNNTLLPSSENDIDQIKLCTFLNENKPDFGVVIAYGKIIPESLLDYPKYGFINIHPSALPRWRGAAPLQHTIFSGDSTTEVCIMKLVYELDAGPVFQRSEPINISQDNLGSLHDCTAQIGAELLPQVLKAITQENLEPINQDTNKITYANKWTKEDCKIIWEDPIEKTYNRIRACSPKPGAYSFYENKLVKLFSTNFMNNYEYGSSKLGALILLSDFKLGIRGPKFSVLEISELQFEGKNKILVKDFLNSHNLRERLRAGEAIFFTS